MTTTTLTTGLFMTAVPSIEENGNVQLQFAFSYDSPPKIEKFVSQDGNTRNDIANFSKEAVTQKFNMRTGQTVMVTGADQVSNSADRQGWALLISLPWAAVAMELTSAPRWSF
jgi:type II secretory pathway component HofQ